MIPYFVICIPLLISIASIQNSGSLAGIHRAEGLIRACKKTDL